MLCYFFTFNTQIDCGLCVCHASGSSALARDDLMFSLCTGIMSIQNRTRTQTANIEYNNSFLSKDDVSK